MPIVDISQSNYRLPEALILDANCLLELKPLSSKPSARQKTISRFLRQVSQAASSGQMLALAPVLTFEECYFKLLQAEYLRVAKQTNQSWKVLYKQQPQLIRRVSPKLQQFRQTVLSIPIIPVEPEDLGKPPPRLEERMLYHIQNILMLPKDAYLLTVAERLNIRAIATFDADFRRAASWAEVYTIL